VGGRRGGAAERRRPGWWAPAAGPGTGRGRGAGEVRGGRGCADGGWWADGAAARAAGRGRGRRGGGRGRKRRLRWDWRKSLKAINRHPRVAPPTAVPALGHWLLHGARPDLHKARWCPIDARPISVAGRSPSSPTCALCSRVPWRPLRLELSYGDGSLGGEGSGRSAGKASAAGREGHVSYLIVRGTGEVHLLCFWIW